jgi:hypothetical protein
MNSQPLDALFTMQSLLSLQGSAAAALLVPNVIGYLVGNKFDPYRKWVSFGLAMLLAYLVAILAPTADWTKWILAFFNGFLIFASAVGINEATNSGRRARAAGKQLFQKWFP